MLDLSDLPSNQRMKGDQHQESSGWRNAADNPGNGLYQAMMGQPWTAFWMSDFLGLAPLIINLGFEMWLKAGINHHFVGGIECQVALKHSHRFACMLGQVVIIWCKTRLRRLNRIKFNRKHSSETLCWGMLFILLSDAAELYTSETKPAKEDGFDPPYLAAECIGNCFMIEM